jgi:hypothetical protein
MGGGMGGGGQVDMNMIAAMIAQGMGGQQQAQQPININIPGGFGAGMPAPQPGMNPNDLMAAITKMLTARGVIQAGTDANGQPIPAGAAGSVFANPKEEFTRIAKIRSSLGLKYIGDAQLRELAYKYPTAFPTGPIGEALKQTLRESDAKAARNAPKIRADKKASDAANARVAADQQRRDDAMRTTTNRLLDQE